MGIGSSIFLLAVGAILAFAVDATVAGLDIHLIGWVLMAAGVLGLVLTMFLLSPRRRRTVTEQVVPGAPVAAAPPSATQRVVRDENI